MEMAFFVDHVVKFEKPRRLLREKEVQNSRLGQRRRQHTENQVLCSPSRIHSSSASNPYFAECQAHTHDNLSYATWDLKTSKYSPIDFFFPS